MRATRERTKTGLVNIIVFAVSQSVEDGMTLLVGLGGGDVALLCGSALYSIQAPLIIQKQSARMATTEHLSMLQVFLSLTVASFLRSITFLSSFASSNLP